MIKPWRWTLDSFEPVQPRVLATYRLHDGRGRERATIWKNSETEFTWHTWDENGFGGENAGATSLDDAQLFCVACIVRQGWAPGGWDVSW